jgi:hypothetical protein
MNQATVNEHAARLERIAAGMLRDGIGAHPTRGHAVVLRQMAASLRNGIDHTAPWTPTSETRRPGAMIR